MKKVPDFSAAKGTPAKKATKATVPTPNTSARATAKVGRAVVTAAAFLALPVVMVPQQAAAQSTVGPPISPTKPSVPPVSVNFTKIETPYRAIKLPGTYTVLGVGEGRTIFKAADGSMFYLDPTTGDKRSVAVDYFLKIDGIEGERRTADAKHIGGGSAFKVKFTDLLVTSIVGVDSKGNAVMQNARNETFTLDPRTGDKVFIK